MREIKFRAWDSLTKTMFKWEVMRTGFLQGFFDGSFCNEIMQYTGLKDKNGKEIYEGDIVKYYDKALAVIEYEDGAYKMDFIIPEKLYKTNLTKQYNSDNVIVIGNIYEHPHLLEGEVK